MKVANAVKKLEKAGFEVKEECGHFVAKLGKELVEFYRNGTSEDVTCIRVRNENNHDDSMTDYCAGVFVDNISHGIRIAMAR